MPVNKVPAGATLRLVLQTGTDSGGNPVLRNKNLANIAAAATDQDLYDVAQALAGLQKHTLSGVRRIDMARLEQA
ncbi:DUF1659 domain-containing protein [Desulfotomaculum copahuensis]|uniref:DUF1659 domain-containing protein n=1 Tax=Desulfotomaculum copahuensis TaxID=1838280 RepID=A0A1B7LGE3_9FIRM|nr:DUF1659 domain-containing protein [Desulfotomaculum copahuensis]OAT85104.1 hypothetical protein A6M21_07085 [Desulfotomaculum copahuensis]